MFLRKNFCVVSSSKEQFLAGKLNKSSEQRHNCRKGRGKCDERREAA
jgi:hypothetical protein